MMSRHHGLCRDIHSSLLQSSVVVSGVSTSGCCRDITVRLCRLYWCRDIKFLVATTAPGTVPFEQVSPFVVTSA